MGASGCPAQLDAQPAEQLAALVELVGKLPTFRKPFAALADFFFSRTTAEKYFLRGLCHSAHFPPPNPNAIIRVYVCVCSWLFESACTCVYLCSCLRGLKRVCLCACANGVPSVENVQNHGQ